MNLMSKDEHIKHISKGLSELYSAIDNAQMNNSWAEIESVFGLIDDLIIDTNFVITGEENQEKAEEIVEEMLFTKTNL